MSDALRPTNQVAALGALLMVLAWSELSAQPIERIEVTGSHIRRIDGETGLPVQVFTREELERSGVQSAQDFLDRVSAHQSAAAWTDAKGIGTPLGAFTATSLRGLGVGRSLVLVNGRRLAPYAVAFESAADISSIPLAAIERVEVLKDGASAVYGSDAIGGVINFILRRDYSGGDVAVTALQTQNQGGESWRANASVGYGNLQREGFNVFIVADHLRQHALRADQRDFSATGYIPWLGLDTTSGFSFPANVRQLIRDPGGEVVGGFFLPRNVGGACAPPASFSTEAPPRQCRFDIARASDLLPESEKSTFLGRFEKQLGQGHHAFAELVLYRAEFLYRIPPLATSVELMPGSPFYPAMFVATQPGGDPGQPVTADYRLVELGARTKESRSDAHRLVVGLEGALGAWEYLTGVTHSTNRVVTGLVSGYVSRSAFDDLAMTGVVNPFGANTDEVVRRMRATEITGKTGENRTTHQGLDAKISGDLTRLRHGPLSVAVGFETKREDIRMTNEPIVVSGDILGGSGTAPALNEARRQSWSLFAEANAPLAPRFEANFAVRVDRYSDFGSTTNPKMTLRWQALDALLLRASAGTGFRAPALFELFEPHVVQGQDRFTGDDPARCPTTNSPRDCEVQFPVLLGGNPELAAERSRQMNIGMVFEPTRTFSAAFDYYRVEVRDLIGHPGFQFEHVARGSVDPQFPQLPGPIEALIDIPRNLGTLETSGIDVDLAYRGPDSARGRFALRLTGTYVLKYSKTNASVLYPEGPGRAGALGGVVSRWRHHAAAEWTRGSWGATLSQQFQNGYSEPDLTSCNPECSRSRRVGSYSTLNGQLRYGGVRNLSLELGVLNALDRAPPLSSQKETFQAGYDPSYGDPRGRTYYATFRWSYR